MSSSAITVRQQLAQRPGSQYCTESRSLAFGRGSMFSFSLHSTTYEADAATIRIPGGMRLRLSSASVNRKEMNDFLRVTTGGGKTAVNGGGIALRFSSEENGDMIPICTFDGERGGELHQTGLGIEGAFFLPISFCPSPLHHRPPIRSRFGSYFLRDWENFLVFRPQTNVDDGERPNRCSRMCFAVLYTFQFIPHPGSIHFHLVPIRIVAPDARAT
jgi:hypothetical protein